MCVQDRKYRYSFGRLLHYITAAIQKFFVLSSQIVASTGQAWGQGLCPFQGGPMCPLFRGFIACIHCVGGLLVCLPKNKASDFCCELEVSIYIVGVLKG